MKKTYVRPAIFHESFELTQHIASCGVYLQLSAPEVCRAKDNQPTIEPGLFLDQTAACTQKANNLQCELYCITAGVNDGVSVLATS